MSCLISVAPASSYVSEPRKPVIADSRIEDEFLEVTYFFGGLAFGFYIEGMFEATTTTPAVASTSAKASDTEKGGSESLPETNPEASEPSSSHKKKNRCHHCNKKVGLTGEEGREF